MKEPEGNRRPRHDAVFREIFTRGVRPCLHRRSDSGRNARLSEMLEPAPRSVEDPRRALSMPRLPGNPFGQEGHRFRKEARSLMKQVAISLLPVSGLPQEGHLRCTRAQVPGIADRRTDKARAVPVGFRERSDALLRTSGGGRSGSEGPLGRPPVACRHIDNLSYTHPSVKHSAKEFAKEGGGHRERTGVAGARIQRRVSPSVDRSIVVATSTGSPSASNKDALVSTPSISRALRCEGALEKPEKGLRYDAPVQERALLRASPLKSWTFEASSLEESIFLPGDRADELRIEGLIEGGIRKLQIPDRPTIAFLAFDP